jgi:hypothetical protein
MGKKVVKTGDAALLKRASIVDDLAEFESFRDEVLPILRADIVNPDLDAQGMLRKYVKLAAARGINIALTAERQDLALKAIQDIMDRVHGKPTQKNEHEHSFKDLSDDDLDAVLVAEMKVAGAKRRKD